MRPVEIGPTEKALRGKGNRHHTPGDRFESAPQSRHFPCRWNQETIYYEFSPHSSDQSPAFRLFNRLPRAFRIESREALLFRWSRSGDRFVEAARVKMVLTCEFQDSCGCAQSLRKSKRNIASVRPKLKRSSRRILNSAGSRKVRSREKMSTQLTGRPIRAGT